LATREGQLAGEITILVAFVSRGSINDSSKEAVLVLTVVEGSGKEVNIRE